ncbi:hypothetical protein BOTBODRAFT_176171 [Botryobasidium botryosum FD-172 SS1]|uniref:BTB domain-containing protein n=1 Tax=Botryobasidium botryosum (strain FD-172 SS1) TaxID=930990 RepID=A0A067MDH0_BOTB1|nr:hypothetical protein BOTBODRAFT_176171 [Botryobasidium botryosum FD-172 SS1]
MPISLGPPPRSPNGPFPFGYLPTSPSPHDTPASYFDHSLPKHARRRPSFLAVTSHWLSSHHRSSSKDSPTSPVHASPASPNAKSLPVSLPFAPALPPIRISAPQLASALDMFATSPPKSAGRSLGMGAQVVRTPEEALIGTAALFRPLDQRSDTSSVRTRTSSRSSRQNDSPPLPPIPLEQATPLPSKSSPNLPALNLRPSSPKEGWRPMTPPKSLRTPPVPSANAPLPPLPTNSVRASASQKTQPLPPLPPTPPQAPTDLPTPMPLPSLPALPPFNAMLMSPLPTPSSIPCSIIVSLETTSCVLRTTKATLTSRPSHLATYLNQIMPECTTAPPSPSSPFSEAFRLHQESVGCLLPPPPPPPQPAQMIHVFLDRPTAPYHHILAYLRSVDSDTAVLPRAALSSSRTALVELRDEARYLGLTELEQLCTDELRRARSNTFSSSRRSGRSNSASGKDAMLPPLPHSHSLPASTRTSHSGDSTFTADRTLVASVASGVASEPGQWTDRVNDLGQRARAQSESKPNPRGFKSSSKWI